MLMVFLKKNHLQGKCTLFIPKMTWVLNSYICLKDFFLICTKKGGNRYIKIILMLFMKKFSFRIIGRFCYPKWCTVKHAKRCIKIVFMVFQWPNWAQKWRIITLDPHQDFEQWKGNMYMKIVLMVFVKRHLFLLNGGRWLCIWTVHITMDLL